MRSMQGLTVFHIGQIVCCTPGGRQRDIQSPRGIEVGLLLLLSEPRFSDQMLQGYYLLGENESPNDTQFSRWKVQGNFGGEDYPDKTRKIFNEGAYTVHHSRFVE